ncbi:hypothetical protein F5Y02DRAFT_429564 [Annulohypoxylon stygium]|nr:hypothetical protein F5Y02DRAFT_429564 [Annulohypoxylon stygium]
MYTPELVPSTPSSFQPPNPRSLTPLTPLTTLFPDFHSLPVHPPNNQPPSPQTPPPISLTSKTPLLPSPSFQEYPGTRPPTPYHAGLPAFSSPSFDVRASSLAPRGANQYPKLRPIAKYYKRPVFTATKTPSRPAKVSKPGNGNGTGNGNGNGGGGGGGKTQGRRRKLFAALLESRTRTSAETSLSLLSSSTDWYEGWSRSRGKVPEALQRRGEWGSREDPVVID